MTTAIGLDTNNTDREVAVPANAGQYQHQTGSTPASFPRGTVDQVESLEPSVIMTMTANAFHD